LAWRWRLQRVNRMIRAKVEGIEFIAANTLQALKLCGLL